MSPTGKKSPPPWNVGTQRGHPMGETQKRKAAPKYHRCCMLDPQKEDSGEEVSA